MGIKHKAVGTELTQAEYEASDSHESMEAAWAEPTRAMDTVYQNTSGKVRLVSISFNLGAGSRATIYTDASNPPTTMVGRVMISAAAAAESAFTFIVQPNHYYKAVSQAGAPTLLEWHEWDIS